MPTSRARPAPAASPDAEAGSASASTSTSIDQTIAELGDWRGETLRRMRALIHAADREVEEEVKWRGTPVWSHDGIVCTGESYRAVVKLTFAKGASLPDPTRLFNASLEGNVRRAIDIREGETVDADAFRALFAAAVVHNASVPKRRAGAAKKATGRPTP